MSKSEISIVSKGLPLEVAATLEKREKARFFMIDHVDRWLSSTQVAEQKKIKMLETTSKVLTVATYVISALLPLAIFYLPAWVPWGICLPSIIILSIVCWKLNSKIAGYKQNNQYVPFFREFLRNRSSKALHPIGEWDLPAVDERCKSDLVAKNELLKKHPRSGKKIERTLGHYNLDMSPYVQQHVAADFAGITKRKENWEGVKKTTGEAVEHLRKGDVVKYVNKRNEALQKAYQNLNPLDFPVLTVKEEIESLVAQYQDFCQRYLELEALYQEGVKLWRGLDFLEASHEIQVWKEYLKLKGKIEKKISPLIKLLELEESTEEDFILALRATQVQKLPLSLVYLLDESKQLKGKLNEWIESHPRKQIATFTEELKEFQDKKILSRGQLQALSKWIETHGEDAHTSIIKLSKKAHFPLELSAYLEDYPDMRYETPQSLLECHYKLYNELKSVIKEYNVLAKAHEEYLGNKEDYDTLLTAITYFKKNYLAPLEKQVLMRGETSKVKFFFKSVFRKLPAKPFEKEKLPKDPILRTRKIEEYRLDDLLKKLDHKMLVTNRVRAIGIEVPLKLLIVVEVVFWIYFPNLWAFWGLSLLNIVGAGVSYYINYRLKQMEREKQAIKLQYLLRDHPDIGSIPGTRPRLAKLKDVQQKYGLEGVRPTWARCLAVGDESIPNPTSLEEAKKMMKKIAEEGSQLARKPLEKRLILYRRAYRIASENSEIARERYEKNSKSKEAPKLEKRARELKKQARKLEKKVKELDAVVNPEKKPRKSYPKPKLSEYERLTQQQTMLDKRLDIIVEEMLALRVKLKDFQSKSRLFERLPKLVEKYEKKEVIAVCALQLLTTAMEGEHERDSIEDIETVIGDVKPIFKDMLKNGKSEENTEQLQEQLERLKQLPIDTLYLYGKQHLEPIMEEKSRLEHQLKMIQEEPDYRNKEVVGAKIERIEEKLEELEENRVEIKKYYDRVTKFVRKNSPKLKPVPPSTYEKLKLALQDELVSNEELVALYAQLNTYEKGTIWWSLPHAIRDEVGGDYLLHICWSAFRSRAVDNEKFLSNEKGNIWIQFLKVDPHRQLEVFHALPKGVREELNAEFIQYSGEELILVTQAAYEEDKNMRKWWKENDGGFIDRYYKLHPFHQSRIYRFLPLCIQRTIDDFTGQSFIWSCERAERNLPSKETKKAFKKWWSKRGARVQKAFERVDLRYRGAVLDTIPAIFKEQMEIA